MLDDTAIATLMLLGDDAGYLATWRIVDRGIIKVLGEACRTDDLATQGIDVEVDDIAVSLLHLR